MSAPRVQRVVAASGVALALLVTGASPALAYYNGQPGTKQVQTCSTSTTAGQSYACTTTTVRCTWRKTWWWWSCN